MFLKNEMTDMNTDSLWKLYPLAREQLVNNKTLEAKKLKSTECKALEVLILNQGKTVSKRVLLEQVWGDRVVSDNSVTQCIAQLRVALNDNGKEQKFIKTLPSKGYMLFEGVVDLIYSEVKKSEKKTSPATQKSVENSHNYFLQAKVLFFVMLVILCIYEATELAHRLNFSKTVFFEPWMKGESDNRSFQYTKTPATEKLYKYLAFDSSHLNTSPIRNLFISKGVSNYYLSCIYSHETIDELKVKNLTFSLDEKFYFIGVTLDEVCR
ncbi:winged helix-turn-helix domain-containing protein [Vibrio parahaemolyticus]|uniref:winged helix-turn-helix domain-containing protein n=1 Tax=Vibrio parahaemolyticus TaxID=670 RepID=UPI001E4B19FA|nr:winged helix-turn-helix domain-containing protein [Vibrio parahaemolyticus]